MVSSVMSLCCCLQFNPLIGSFFSTETAVLKVVTDILAALDRGQISLLACLISVLLLTL